MNSVIEFVRTLGPARLAAMGAVAAGLVGFFIFVMVSVSRPQMGVMFTDLSFEDSVAITKRLDALNAPYELRQDGAIILVPEDRVLRLRMQLAEDGLPSGGTVGYEIFDKGDTLGATSFVQNVNRVRAVEGELARTIRSLSRVESARVHLVLPERQLFARNTPEPSASIVVKVRGSLEAGQIRAIQHLVASAVEGMKPSSVSIVDDGGRLLASGREEPQDALSLTLDERNRAYERRMQREIADIVASIVGDGRAQVRVNAEIDYNRITQTSDLFDPDGRVVRSTQIREETSSASAPAGDQTVSVANELPSANAGEPGQGREREQATKSEEVINYEISRTTKTEVIEGGRIKRLSVAVLVDGVYTTNAQGQVTYAPRPQDQLDEIAALVRTAMGFDQARGDRLHVANLRFADSDVGGAAPAGDGPLTFTRSDYFKMAELAVVLMVAVLVLLFVVRPLVRRIITPDDSARPLDTLLGDAPRLSPPQPSAAANLPALAAPETRNRAVEALKTARIEGEVQAVAVRDVGTIIQNNRDEAKAIVRQWIHEQA